MEPEKVPTILQTKVSYKLLGLIFLAAIIFQSYLYFVETTDQIEEGIAYLSMSTPLLVSAVSLIIAYRYGLSKVFGKAYLVFALAYFSIFLAELTYYAYDVIYGIDPYPSIADVFFFAMYPLLSIHILMNLKFFKTKIPAKQKLLFAAIPIIIFSIYSGASLDEYGGYEEMISDEEAAFDYFYGLIFVAGAAITLSFAALGAIIFRGGLLGVAWALLLIGILIFTIGDVWYYWLEVVGEYDLTHPVNLLWYIPDGIVIYALFKHAKAL